MKVTIKDVAKDAGVSPSTVSRVISNTSRIGEATKIRVLNSIEKLGYTPNILARSLVNKKTKIIGVVMPHEADSLFSNPFYIQAMKGISIAAEKHKYHIMYAFGKNKDNELEAVKNFISSNIVDGICLLTTRKKDECLKYLEKNKFPCVVIGRPEVTDSSNILWVDNNNEETTKEIVKSLSLKGYKNIGYLGAKKNWTVSINREKGFKEQCKKEKIKSEIVYEGEFSRENGYRGAEKLCKNKELTAVICTDDFLAFGVQRYLTDKKIGGIKIIGFNNIDPLGNFGPKFSSVDINALKLGKEAMNLLISKLDGKNKENYKIVKAKLIDIEEELQ
ncbi:MULTISPECIES: LacI family DNA-binding transcriptional regulator [Psychrilyobacter]|uniref:LacI family DNA-binding transcriptional regulator n=1 Tax=Psychrilyobacter piezotolerans TaxID=2293438 RepID=A0ABX9KG63_9FUSO|nr:MULTISPECIES: LacI family DNA-binding transcriptional regulator [Psychrilyobacter]MCS5420450.1 LacI family DNA-binding transcriptional regulator [Psychrilyobacter sp. S5]NDI78229.1 LacI family transcriptional regulator [Psychrilyobacter piezotolerans]RDE61211.1 LacI family transcriptional regulator [Psychrilyobacter sp. S5]REI40879.1 LacI family DNA-binding transcriptional regulator [Psychrilyobacter piezotolerans]